MIARALTHRIRLKIEPALSLVPLPRAPPNGCWPMSRPTCRKIRILCQGALMRFYRAALPLSAQTLSYVAGVIRRHRRQIGSCWRKLNPGRQALLVLVHLRKGETFADLAAGFGVGTATAWRYARETITLLAARAPKLRDALAAARKAGHAFVVIDGTLIPVDRVAADRPLPEY